jgi:hypothetical protein
MEHNVKRAHVCRPQAVHTEDSLWEKRHWKRLAEETGVICNIRDCHSALQRDTHEASEDKRYLQSRHSFVLSVGAVFKRPQS